MANVAADIGSTANRYQILAKLAVGGMAEIFLARGAGVAGVERYCVLKRIRSKLASDARFVEMFIDEARLAAQLQHPNIASVYDVGMLGDSYFFTMEYVHGQTVQSLQHRAIDIDRPLPLACVLTVIANAAAGLHHAHERLSSDGRPLGIVHRDVSPSNLIVSYEGNVKLVDFGVAKAADGSVESRAGTVKGKIGYLSPEQCRGTPVDRRSDLFSLGIVMWEMLAGARLYKRASDFESMVAIVNEPAPPPSSRRADVPRAVDAIVQRLLARSMTERFQTAAEVVEAIEHVSMRAATLLSTSAVSRLLHDLFGAPPEPWLELDGDTIPFQAATPRSPRAPDVLDRAAIEEVEQALAAAPDLTTPMADASGWIVAPVVRSAPVVLPEAPPAPASAAAVPVPPSGAATVVVPRPHAPSVPASSAIAAESVPAVPEPRPPRSPPSPPGSLAGSYATPTRRSAVMPGAQIRWPLVAVIATALVSGVSAAWLSSRGEPPRPPARPVALPVAADSETTAAAEAPRVAPALPEATPKPPEAAPVPSPAAEIQMTPEPVPAVRPQQPPPDDAVQPHGTSATRVRTPAAAPVRSSTTAPTRGAAPPTFKSLSALYQTKDHAAVVAACGRVIMTGDIARLCVLAACYQRDALTARRWFIASSPEQRAQLTASCKQAGNIDIAGSALDCSKNPLDCR